MNALELVTEGEEYGVLGALVESYYSLDPGSREEALFASREIEDIEAALNRPVGDAVEMLREAGIIEHIYASEGRPLKLEASDPNMRVGRAVMERARSQYGGDLARFVDEFDEADGKSLPDIIYSLESGEVQ